MKSTIQWTRKAVKPLGKIQVDDKVKVYEAVQMLEQMPSVAKVKALTQHSYGYRLRVGRYRVLFDWDGGIKVVQIQ